MNVVEHVLFPKVIWKIKMIYASYRDERFISIKVSKKKLFTLDSSPLNKNWF